MGEDTSLGDAATELPESATVVGTAPTLLDESLPPGDSAPASMAVEPRYLPRGELGAGGMGEVRLDLDRRIGREVAVKRLRAKLAGSADARERFLREARVQGQLEHPSIVPVYDLSQAEDGTLSFTMRRVRGRTLREVLEAREAGDEGDGLQKLLSTWRQVCQAIDYAHSRGVIHRDLKPDNVMLGDFGEVYVLDWGIARLGDTPDDVADDEAADGGKVLSGKSASTRYGAMLGTPGYMPPEQLEGDLQRLDARADVYALGAVLLEILAGVRLHEGDTLDDLKESYARDPEADIRAACANRDVAPELVQLCVEATTREVERRLESAGALAERVERYLEGDRDMRMRTEQADAHAVAAHEAADRAFEEEDDEARAEAASRVAQALALAPDHAAARRTLMQLLTRPPAREPEAVRTRLDEAETRDLAYYYRGSIFMILLYVPIAIWVAFVEHLENWPVRLVVVSIVLSIAACVHGLRAPRPGRDWRSFAVLVTVTASLAAAARFIGPLTIVPLLAGLNTIVGMLFPGRAPRWLIALVGTCPVALLMLLELGGVLPPTTTWANGTLTMRGAVIHLDGNWVLPFLVAINTLPPVATTFVVGWTRDRDQAARRELAMQRWQLEQLVPKG